jgi:hypothetical protein
MEGEQCEPGLPLRALSVCLDESKRLKQRTHHIITTQQLGDDEQHISNAMYTYIPFIFENDN